MPYGSWNEINDALKGIKPKISLEQANLIAGWADKIEADAPWGVAIAQFKKAYHVGGGKWVKNKELELFTDEQVGQLFDLARAAREASGMTSEEAFEAFVLAIGEGQGKGGGKQKVGGTDTCVCPECGKEVPHTERGTPCAEMECPECGAKMQGKTKELEGKVTKGEGGKSYPASDYLVVEDPESPTTWHLRITKTPGGPSDHAQCGAAWAALHEGHRGNKYLGPNKAAAIKKLTAIYKKNEWPLPTEAEDSDESYEDIERKEQKTYIAAEDPLCYFGPIELDEANTPEFARNRNRDGTPMWIPLHRLGEWDDPRYGHFVMTQEKMEQAASNFLTCVHRPDSPIDAQVPVDTRHQGDAACGWLHEMRLALPYLWGRPGWTDKGRGIVLDKQYRYVSPRYLDDPKRGPIFQEITLTNRDFLKMPPLDGEGPTVFLSDDEQAVIIERQEVNMDKIKLMVGGVEKELTPEEVQSLIATGELTAKELAGAKAELEKAKVLQDAPRDAITLTQADGTPLVLSASVVADLMRDNQAYRKERKERAVRDALRILQEKNVEPIVVQMMEPILWSLSPEAEGFISLEAGPAAKSFGFVDGEGKATAGKMNLWVALTKLIEQIPARSNDPRTTLPPGKRPENTHLAESDQYDPTISLEEMREAEQWAAKQYVAQGKQPRIPVTEK